MNKLSVSLRNCYGIKELDYEFDFNKSNVYSIYAPNGTMKTSFAKTFVNISRRELPKDLINNIDGSFELKDEMNAEVNPENIFPIKSMNLDFEPKEMSGLLVNKEDKEEYDAVFSGILRRKNDFIRKLNSVSKLTQAEIEKQMLLDFSKKGGDFFELLSELVSGLDETEDLSDVYYKTIFEDKVLELLKKPEIITNIKAYETKYNEIIGKYKFYKQGVFTPYKANVLLKSLSEQKFFEITDNKLLLSGVDNAIENESDLKKQIDDAIEQIDSDAKLKEIRESISKWTKPLQDFQDLMETKGGKIITKLTKLDDLKKSLWMSYLFKYRESLDELLTEYKNGIEQLKAIQLRANLEKTKWSEVVGIFKERFIVPFEIDIEDATNTILGNKEPIIVFKFLNESTGKYDIIHKKQNLLGMEVLSGGELRAMYLLYILFEIKDRQEKGGEHILVIDDIADSFDYKNKYAIIEYLKEISEDKNFKMIILTHNFDFYRSIQMRLFITKGDEHWAGANLTVLKSFDGKVDLISGREYLQPIAHFIKNYKTCNYKLVSLIPVARNLIEYMLGENDEDYIALTSMLHIKKDKFKTGKLFEIYNWLFLDSKEPESEDGEDVIGTVYLLCDEIIKSTKPEALNLETKIVLSIGIRLKAEEFMLKFEGIEEQDSFQTRKLFDLCSENKLIKAEEEKILKKVLIMTPEAIHLNSFMYEPILDISDIHLVNLYKEICLI